MGDEEPRMFSENLRIRKDVADDFSHLLTTTDKTVAEYVHDALQHDNVIQIMRELANGDRRHEYRELTVKLYGDDWLEIGDIITKLRRGLDENDILQLIFKIKTQRR